MTKYIVEGGINFFDELNKSLNEKEDEQENVSSDVCLISNTLLTDNFVTLECKHKFNYGPIYNDIVNHKIKYNMMEKRQLKMLELRCPYCRNIQTKLLPECDGYINVHGVNYINELMLPCKNPETLINGYMLGTCCHEISAGVKCSNTYVKLLEADGKIYCYYHKYG